MRIVGEHDVGKEPHELFERVQLTDEHVAVDSRIPADTEIPLQEEEPLNASTLPHPTAALLKSARANRGTTTTPSVAASSA